MVHLLPAARIQFRRAFPSSAAVVRCGTSSIPKIRTGSTNSELTAGRNALEHQRHSPPASIESQWSLPYKGHVGMLCLIAAESAIFTIFVVAYLSYIGKSLSGPTPREVLDFPSSLRSACSRAASPFTPPSARSAKANFGAFRLWWFVTLVLGSIFLIDTGREWHHLIYDKGLTISTNLFGTTYYSLVGLHAFHVTCWPDRAAHRFAFGSVRQGPTGAREKRRHVCDVLALCRRGVDRGFYRCLHHRALRRAQTKCHRLIHNPAPVTLRPPWSALPAPTAWPIVLAFGVTLLIAGIITSRLGHDSRCNSRGGPVVLAGSSMCFPHEKHVQVPVVDGTNLDHYASPRSRSIGNCSRTAPRASSARNLSRLRRHQRWTGRQRRHGGARLPLRRPQARKHLVSHQSAGRHRVFANHEARPMTL